jgi:transcriptional regulator with XRE-family HTH domain
MPENRFGEELRRLRREAGLSLADLADAIGSSIAYVSDMERGKKNPPGAIKLRRLLGRLGREELYDHMLHLAYRSRRSVEFAMEDTSEDVADMLIALKRQDDEGGLDEKTAKLIRKLLEKRRQQ